MQSLISVLFLVFGAVHGQEKYKLEEVHQVELQGKCADLYYGDQFRELKLSPFVYKEGFLTFFALYGPSVLMLHLNESNRFPEYGSGKYVYMDCEMFISQTETANKTRPSYNVMIHKDEILIEGARSLSFMRGWNRTTDRLHDNYELLITMPDAHVVLRCQIDRNYSCTTALGFPYKKTNNVSLFDEPFESTSCSEAWSPSEVECTRDGLLCMVVQEANLIVKMIALERQINCTTFNMNLTRDKDMQTLTMKPRLLSFDSESRFDGAKLFIVGDDSLVATWQLGFHFWRFPSAQYTDIQIHQIIKTQPSNLDQYGILQDIVPVSILPSQNQTFNDLIIIDKRGNKTDVRHVKDLNARFVCYNDEPLGVAPDANLTVEQMRRAAFQSGQYVECDAATANRTRCYNGGICRVTSSGQYSHCFCEPGYDGANCLFRRYIAVNRQIYGGNTTSEANCYSKDPISLESFSLSYAQEEILFLIGQRYELVDKGLLIAHYRRVAYCDSLAQTRWYSRHGENQFHLTTNRPLNIISKSGTLQLHPAITFIKILIGDYYYLKCGLNYRFSQAAIDSMDHVEGRPYLVMRCAIDGRTQLPTLIPSDLLEPICEHIYQPLCPREWIQFGQCFNFSSPATLTRQPSPLVSLQLRNNDVWVDSPNRYIPYIRDIASLPFDHRIIFGLSGHSLVRIYIKSNNHISVRRVAGYFNFSGNATGVHYDSNTVNLTSEEAPNNRSLFPHRTLFNSPTSVSILANLVEDERYAFEDSYWRKYLLETAGFPMSVLIADTGNNCVKQCSLMVMGGRFSSDPWLKECKVLIGSNNPLQGTIPKPLEYRQISKYVSINEVMFEKVTSIDCTTTSKLQSCVIYDAGFKIVYMLKWAGSQAPPSAARYFVSHASAQDSIVVDRQGNILSSDHPSIYHVSNYQTGEYEIFEEELGADREHDSSPRQYSAWVQRYPGVILKAVDIRENVLQPKSFLIIFNHTAGRVVLGIVSSVSNSQHKPNRYSDTDFFTNYQPAYEITAITVTSNQKERLGNGLQLYSAHSDLTQMILVALKVEIDYVNIEPAARFDIFQYKSHACTLWGPGVTYQLDTEHLNRLIISPARTFYQQGEIVDLSCNGSVLSNPLCSRIQCLADGKFHEVYSFLNLIYQRSCVLDDDLFSYSQLRCITVGETNCWRRGKENSLRREVCHKYATLPAHCLLPPRASIFCNQLPQVAYYYNRITQNCEAFLWTGCNGNRNRFETKANCLRECPEDFADRNGLYPDPNPPADQCRSWVNGSYFSRLTFREEKIKFAQLQAIDGAGSYQFSCLDGEQLANPNCARVKCVQGLLLSHNIYSDTTDSSCFIRPSIKHLAKLQCVRTRSESCYYRRSDLVTGALETFIFFIQCRSFYPDLYRSHLYGRTIQTAGRNNLEPERRSGALEEQAISYNAADPKTKIRNIYVTDSNAYEWLIILCAFGGLIVFVGLLAVFANAARADH